MLNFITISPNVMDQLWLNFIDCFSAKFYLFVLLCQISLIKYDWILSRIMASFFCKINYAFILSFNFDLILSIHFYLILSMSFYLIVWVNYFVWSINRDLIVFINYECISFTNEYLVLSIDCDLISSINFVNFILKLRLNCFGKLWLNFIHKL